MKNIFSFKLFKEALRQIKIPFFLAFGVLLGILAIMDFAIISDAVTTYRESGIVTYIDIPETYFFLHIIFALVTPIFTLKLFKFLTKRNASDFYHAIPQKRICLFVTYSVSIIVATTILLLVSVVVPTIPFLLAGKYVRISVASLLAYVLNSFICMLLVLSIILLSSAMTGTLFTNILFAIVMLVGPRFIIAVITDTITSSFYWVLPTSPDFGIFSNSINLVWNQIYFLFSYDKNAIYKIGLPTLYTLVLAIIYYLLATRMFNKRRSEQAENSLNNPFAQHIIRTCIGFVFSIFIVLRLFDVNQHHFDNYVVFELLSYAFIAICAMSFFEIFTSKKVKNLLNVAKTIPVVAVLCLSVFLVLKIAEISILNYEPDASKISYIRYNNGYIGFNSDIYYNEYYYNYKTSKVKFDDEKIIEFVVEKYNEKIEDFKETYYSSDNDYYYYDYYDTLYYNNEITVEFNQGFSKVERVLHLTESEYEEFCKLAYSNKDYFEARSTLPKDYTLTFKNKFLTNDEIYELMEVFEEEIKELSISELECVLNYDYSYCNNLMELSFKTYVDSSYYTFNVFINSNVPKTITKLFEILDSKQNEQTDKLNKICDILNNSNQKNNKKIYLDCNITVYELKTGINPYNNTCNLFNEEYFKKDIEAVNTMINDHTEFNKAKYIVFVDGYIEDTDNRNSDNINTYFFTDNEALLNSIFKQ